MGKYKVQIGLILRQAMLLKEMLHISEVWIDIKKDEIKLLTDVDEFFLRYIFKAHKKSGYSLYTATSLNCELPLICHLQPNLLLQCLLLRNKKDGMPAVFLPWPPPCTPQWCERVCMVN